MTDVASRELRNNTRQLLDRVAGGEDIRIMVDGRPVAILTMAPRRPTSIPRAEFLALFDGHQADPGLADFLRELTDGETTDDMPW